MEETPFKFLDEVIPTDAATPESEPSPLVIDEEDRYSSLRLIPWWRQERLLESKVLVVGAGALGNEVIKNLALVGVGTTYVVDLDTIESSNLSRSVLFRSEDAGKSKAEVVAQRALELNPEIRVLPFHGDIISDVGLGLFRDVDVVIGCLDNREARLWVNRQCWKVGTPWVDAGIQEIQGVVKVFVPPVSACYECAMTERDYQLLNLRYSCPLLRRDQILEGKVPTAPTIASMMAALEVQEALKILHGLPVEGGSALVFNGVSNQFYRTQLPFREECLSHEHYPEPIALELTAQDLVATLFDLARRDGMTGPFVLALDRELVVSVNCPRCGWQVDVRQPRTRVSQRDTICPNCQAPGRPEFASQVEEATPLSALRLIDVGIAPFDIVRVDGTEASQFFLLNGDRQWYDQPRARKSNGER